jgi:nicotinic acid phosphoribosyltransferase
VTTSTLTSAAMSVMPTMSHSWVIQQAM